MHGLPEKGKETKKYKIERRRATMDYINKASWIDDKQQLRLQYEAGYF